MVTVSIKKEYAKIAELKRKSTYYQNKYQTDYETFCDKIARDEVFINMIENNIDKLWEIDLSDWEFCDQGIKDWTNKL